MSGVEAAWNVLAVMSCTTLLALTLNWTTGINVSIAMASSCGAVVACLRMVMNGGGR